MGCPWKSSSSKWLHFTTKFVELALCEITDVGARNGAKRNKIPLKNRWRASFLKNRNYKRMIVAPNQLYVKEYTLNTDHVTRRLNPRDFKRLNSTLPASGVDILLALIFCPSSAVFNVWRVFIGPLFTDGLRWRCFQVPTNNTRTFKKNNFF